MLRLGIDMSGFVYGKSPGFNEYALSLLEGMGGCCAGVASITVFVRRGQGRWFRGSSSCISVRETVWAGGEIGRFVWHHVVPWLTSHRFDAFLFPSNFMPILAPRASVLVVHDLNFRVNPRSFSLKQRLYREAFSRMSITRSRGVIAISQSTAAEVLGFCGRTAFVIRNPVRNRFTAESRPTHQILCASSLLGHKNIPAAAEACLRLVEEDEQFSAVFIGNWSPQDFPLAQRHPRIRVLGFVDDTTRASLMAESRAVLAPSTYEGFGMPYVEALMAGRSLICSDIEIAREVIGDVAYWIAPPYGVEQIVAGIRTAIQADFVAPANAAQIIERYRPRHVASLYLDYIASVVHGGNERVQRGRGETTGPV